MGQDSERLPFETLISWCKHRKEQFGESGLKGPYSDVEIQPTMAVRRPKTPAGGHSRPSPAEAAPSPLPVVKHPLLTVMCDKSFSGDGVCVVKNNCEKVGSVTSVQDLAIILVLFYTEYPTF